VKLHIQKDTESKTALIFIQDSSSSTGAGLTGLVYNSSGLSWYYYREKAGTGATQVTLATATLGVFTSGGFVEVDQTDLPGWYEIGIPNACLATNAEFVGMQLKGASNMAPLNIEIQLTELGLSEDAPITAADIESECDDALTAYLPDIYHADIDLSVDEANTQDEYTVTWFKNGVRVTSGITSPTIQVVKRVDGTDLIASTATTQIGTTASYKKDESSNRITAGEAVLAIVGGTIDGSARSFAKVISRDSSA
jgi:hypothetical protein